MTKRERELLIQIAIVVLGHARAALQSGWTPLDDLEKAIKAVNAEVPDEG